MCWQTALTCTLHSDGLALEVGWPLEDAREWRALLQRDALAERLWLLRDRRCGSSDG